MEHKLLSESWLDFLGHGGRRTVTYDIPPDGAKGPVPKRWEPVPLGEAVMRRQGTDLTLVSLGVGVHRALEAARKLEEEKVSAGVLDLRTVAPIDVEMVREAVAKTGRLVVVDEDYEKSNGVPSEIPASCAGAWSPLFCPCCGQ